MMSNLTYYINLDFDDLHGCGCTHSAKYCVHCSDNGCIHCCGGDLHLDPNTVYSCAPTCGILCLLLLWNKQHQVSCCLSNS